MSWLERRIEKITHQSEWERRLQQLQGQLAEKEKELKLLSVRLRCVEEQIDDHTTEELLIERLSALEKHQQEMATRLDALREQVDVLCSDIENRNNQSAQRLAQLEQGQMDLLARSDEYKRSVEEAFSQQKETIDVCGYTLTNSVCNLWRNMPPGNRERPRVHFIRCLDIYNAGDMNCGPEQYFQALLDGTECFFHSLKNIRYDLIGEHDWVILGGGGLLDCNWQYQRAINRVLELSDRVVSWGLGHNKHSSDCIYAWEPDVQIDYARFFLFTTRDWNYQNERFCPCVSCMMPDLEKVYEKKRRIGVLTHHDIRIDVFSEDICDNSQPLESILEFIGGSEIIITNTYHGAYWATLMNKRVILYQPFSNRFDFFKYPPTLYSGDLEADIVRARTYPEALEECRRINIELKDELLKLMMES